jgi:putative transposase
VAFRGSLEANMPRANRYIQPGCLYHLTHRCHDRKFLFRFAVVRSEYRRRLRATLEEFGVSLLAYALTSNHTHLLAEAPAPNAISQMMQKLEGEFAEWYNLRQGRSGAFGGDRYHCTLVDGGSHAWNCMKYIDLNMVRAGIVRHPEAWEWCGYHELAGLRQRYRLLDLECVRKWLGGVSREALTREYVAAVAEGIRVDELTRNPDWTESIAVGSEEFVKRVSQQVLYRSRLERQETSEGVWTVRESSVPYKRFGGSKNAL